MERGLQLKGVWGRPLCWFTRLALIEYIDRSVRSLPSRREMLNDQATLSRAIEQVQRCWVPHSHVFCVILITLLSDNAWRGNQDKQCGRQSHAVPHAVPRTSMSPRTPAHLHRHGSACVEPNADTRHRHNFGNKLDVDAYDAMAHDSIHPKHPCNQSPERPTRLRYYSKIGRGGLWRDRCSSDT